MSFFITISRSDKTIKNEYDSPILLTDAIAESGFSFDAPCGGRGICGNCKVIASGDLSPATQAEKDFLGEGIYRRERLSCMTVAKGDCVIEIPSSELDSVQFTQNGEYNENKFACAVDVGTTGLVFRYYSLPSGKIVFSEHIDNPQRVRGADVLTRINYAIDGGLNELKELIENAIIESENRFGHKVESYVFSGNTTMLHILSGRNPEGIATAPFEPETLFGYWEGNRYYMRCASAYIGADVIASLIASNALEKSERFALLDIGTNNECILFDGKQLYACSSPAGPAFEGGNISCGMTAREGAIYSVTDNNGSMDINTINDSVPIGFCGSGLIDAVAFLLKNGYIAYDGSIIKELPYFGKPKLSGEDIAELQLAKSAVAAGLMTLCDYAKISIDDIDTVYLTGSFGSRITVQNAEYIGLIPKGFCEKAVFICDGAINGASMLITDNSYFERSSEIAESITTVELADSEYFAKSFIENLYF